jgi:hypothetical protein
MPNDTSGSSPATDGAAEVPGNGKEMTAATAPTEDAATATLSSDSPGEEQAEATAMREEMNKDATDSASETKPDREAKGEKASTHEAPDAESKPDESSKLATETAEETKPEKGAKKGSKKKKEEKAAEQKAENTDASVGPVVSSSKRTRPPYKYDPQKVTLRFLFANKDGLTVTVECKPGDTVGEVKGQLLSVWPEGEFSCRWRTPHLQSCD